MRNVSVPNETPVAPGRSTDGNPRERAIGWRNCAAIGLMALVLAACGAGPSDSSSEPKSSAVPVPTTQVEASRFLAQSTMGANQSSISHLSTYGYAIWLDEQFGAPARSAHKAYLDAVIAALAPDEPANETHVMNTFWHQAANAPDQLRQRVAFALSQIFVISLQDGNVAEYPRGVAAYLDMLGRNAFGNYRDLLEAVTLHPMMGLYLSHMRNQFSACQAITNFRSGKSGLKQLIVVHGIF